MLDGMGLLSKMTQNFITFLHHFLRKDNKYMNIFFLFILLNSCLTATIIRTFQIKSIQILKKIALDAITSHYAVMSK